MIILFCICGFQASNDNWFHAITKMDKQIVKEIEEKQICEDSDLYATILAVSSERPEYYDAFRTARARTDLLSRMPIVRNVITALSWVSSFELMKLIIVNNLCVAAPQLGR